MNLVQGKIAAVYIIGNSKWDWAAGYAIAKAAGYQIDETSNHMIMYSKHMNEHIL